MKKSRAWEILNPALRSIWTLTMVPGKLWNGETTLAREAVDDPSGKALSIPRPDATMKLPPERVAIRRLPARPLEAEPEPPFWRDAPFEDAPLRVPLARGDVVRLAAVVRLADVVRRFLLAAPLRAVDRFVVFVLGSEPDVVVLRRVAGLDFLVVAIGFLPS